VIISLGQPYEVIFVDDGSRDNSYDVLVDLSKADSNIRVIRLTRNFGQHQATLAGLNAARGDVIVTLDADLQNPPEEIPKLVAKIGEGYEVVFGVLKSRKHPIFRRAGSVFTKKVLAMVLPSMVTNLSGFRAMRSYVVENLSRFNERSKFLDALICWMGYRVGIVDVAHGERFSGKTKYSVVKLVGMWFDIVVSLTNLPLKVATMAGVVLGVVSVLLALFYAILYFAYGYSVPGFATLVILVCVFAGIQLFCLGVLGEYIGRMNGEVKKRPEYIIRDEIGRS
jgi:glycosyltransferase involved in cell wall biosynthesis